MAAVNRFVITCVTSKSSATAFQATASLMMEKLVLVGGNVSCNTDEYVSRRSIIIVMIMLIIIVYLTDPLDSYSVINYIAIYFALLHEYGRRRRAD